MSDSRTITVIGSLNKDLITRTPRIPSAGETLVASSFDTGSGGKGANQAVACARLAGRGRRRRRSSQEQQQQHPPQQHNDEIPDQARQDLITIKMIGAVGDDEFGRDLIAELSRNGVDVTGVRIRKGERTGVAVVLVDDESGENRILVSPQNANYTLTPADFVTLPDPRPDLILLQLEIPLDTVCRVIQLAKAAGVSVLLNPAPAPAGGLPREVYSGLTHLILNESEAEILCRGLSKKEEEEEEEGGEEPRNPAKTAQTFLNMGVENVVITLGAQGAYYASSPSSPSPSAGHQPIPETPINQIIDTTGAGDTFVGAYAVKTCEEKSLAGFDLPAVVKWANRAAARSVLRKGAQEAMPWREEMVDG